MGKQHSVIIDGDWGGDEKQLTAVLLAHSEDVDILGVTCVFGNTDHNQVVQNALDILHFLNASHLPVHRGADRPSDQDALEGDGAHGANGVGGVILPRSPKKAQEKTAVDFILDQLRTREPGTVTITASGPLTNIAQAFTKDKATMQKVKKIIIMGGCTHDMPAHDMKVRRGNITPHAEFNFQQAAPDAETVMKSGLPIVLLPMNCTHQLTFTPEREKQLADIYHKHTDIQKQLVGMIAAPKELDAMKFNVAPVMHDIHCALFLLYPEQYNIIAGAVTVSGRDDLEWNQTKLGHTDFKETPDSNLHVAIGIQDPDCLFGIFMQSIQHCIRPEQALLPQLVLNSTSASASLHEAVMLR